MQGMSVSKLERGAHVVATEQAERLRLLQRNIERHGKGQGAPWDVGRRGGSIDTLELDWFTPGPDTVECDLILATDVNCV